MAKKKTGIWRIIDDFEGDKFIWMIVLLLIMLSILAISSSTSLLALQTGSTRSAIINKQIFIAVIGLGIIIACYNFLNNIKFLKFVAQTGFAISLFLLLCLAVRIRTPLIRAEEINGAVRTLRIFGLPFQLHVFEFVKLFMVLYLAWACQTFKDHGFALANRLGENPHFAFLKKKRIQVLVYIILPVIIITVLILMGSASSALFIGAIMIVTVLLGGAVSLKESLPIILAGILLLGGCVGLSFATNGKVFPRIHTATSRLTMAGENMEDKLVKAANTTDFQEVLDKVKQPISAKVAVSEGGFFGKGPGRSTQRYVVPVMFEDYMFSFIVEEYGILGALLVIILYGTLLARGSIIAKNCTTLFSKTVVAGLIITISGQAMMHMLINVDLGPLTGQTLPMLSHGASSFLAFSISFGIILSISRMVKKKVEKDVAQMKPILEVRDDVRESLDDLDQLDALD